MAVVFTSEELSTIACKFIDSIGYSETTRLNVEKLILIYSLVGGSLYENESESPLPRPAPLSKLNANSRRVTSDYIEGGNNAVEAIFGYRGQPRRANRMHQRVIPCTQSDSNKPQGIFPPPLPPNQSTTNHLYHLRAKSMYGTPGWCNWFPR